MKATRKEHDFLGELEIPNEVYYGVQTFRAIENFNITGIPISKEPLFIKALGYVKKAAAMLSDPMITKAEVAKHFKVSRTTLNAALNRNGFKI